MYCAQGGLDGTQAHQWLSKLGGDISKEGAHSVPLVGKGLKGAAKIWWGPVPMSLCPQTSIERRFFA